MPTQQTRRRDAQRRLLNAAQQVLTGQGFEAASLTEIGQLAGMSRAAASYHFGSKQALLAALIDDLAARAAGAPRPPAGLAPAQVLDAYCRPLVADPAPARAAALLIRETRGPALDLQPAAAALQRQLIGHARRALQTLQREGAIIELQDAHATAAALTGGLLGLLLTAPAEDLAAGYAEYRASWLARLTPGDRS